MSKLVVIRDPVYNYLNVTAIEKAIVDKPCFQRLRFVLQNSSAYLTYPSNNNSRFLHSLGVMHLAGEMLLNGLQQASAKDLAEFLERASDDFDIFLETSQSSEPEIMAGWRSMLGDAARFAHSPHVGETLFPSEKQRFLINALWQSTRLAALIHDIGHFPLSHLFEYAFEDFFSFAQDKENFFEKEYMKRYSNFRKHMPDEVKEELPTTEYPTVNFLDKYPLHELWGMLLVHELKPDRGHGENEGYFCNFVFRVAKIISIVNPDPQNGVANDKLHIFRTLHTLVAGELDADRLDYCVRDPQSSGLELGAIDVNRIARSMTLVKDSNSKRFVILPNSHALTSLESFYHQRHLIYCNLIYHHNVVRLNGIAQEIVFIFLSEASKVANGASSPIQEIIKQFGLWDSGGQSDAYHFLARGFQYYDDAWLRTFMSQCLWELQQKKHQLSPDHIKLVLLLEIFLYRQTQHVTSFWKRESDSHSTIDWLFNELKAEPSCEAITLEKIESFLSPFSESPSFRNLLIKPLKEELKKDNVILVHRVMTPKLPLGPPKGETTDSKPRAQILVDGIPQECWKISSYFSALSSVKSNTTIYFGFVAQNLKTNVELRNKCVEIVKRHLKEYVKIKFCEV